MTTFCETVRKSDGTRRYYVGGCRTTRQVFNTVGDSRKDSFLTIETATHWKHYHCRSVSHAGPTGAWPPRQ